MVPNLLLKYSSKINLESLDLLVLLAFFYFQQLGKEPLTSEEFAQLLNLPEKQIQVTLEAMIARGLIRISENGYDPSGLFEKIADLWAEEKVQALQEARRETATAAQVKTAERSQTPLLGNLFRIFEQEFGRPLTPMECTHILRWYKDEGYSEDLILEALKRAVLRGIFNLNYIDRILSHWARNNLKTTQEINQYEEKFFTQRQLRKGKFNLEGTKSEDKEEKYKDLYLT
ncbi:MAG: DnaD domain protein [Bacillota bacterium]|nr:DnaD domain protein [Bacillota bacterium]